MNEETMRKHYDKTPKETLINILIASREQIEKLKKARKLDIETTEKVEYEDLLKNYYEKMEIIEEQDKEIERLNNIIEEAIEYINVNTNKGIYESGYGRGTALTICKEHLLEILNGEELKGSDKE